MDEQKLTLMSLLGTLPKRELRRVAQVVDEIDVGVGKELLQ